jgi:4-hydroxy-3-methylbut-2-enyl diphosphate reductase
VLVVGSTNSSNSNRLVEVSRNLGTIGYLIDNSQAIDPKWLEGVSTVAVTAGASAPEVLVEDVVNYLRQNGYDNVEEVEVMPENVRFGLPPEIVQAIGSAGGAEAHSPCGEACSCCRTRDAAQGLAFVFKRARSWIAEGR